MAESFKALPPYQPPFKLKAESRNDPKALLSPYLQHFFGAHDLNKGKKQSFKKPMPTHVYKKNEVNEHFQSSVYKKTEDNVHFKRNHYDSETTIM